MSRKTAMPKPFTLLLPVAFTLLLILFLPLIFGTAEVETDPAALEHGEAAAGILGALLTGDLLLPAVFIVACTAVVVAALAFVYRRAR